MNTRIFTLITENLNDAFHLEKYSEIRNTFGKNTVINDLPWTPARQSKFTDHIADTLQFESDEIDLSGTIEESVTRLDRQYMSRFFGEIWQPKTEIYQYSGWSLVEAINKRDP